MRLQGLRPLRPLKVHYSATARPYRLHPLYAPYSLVGLYLIIGLEPLYL